MCSNDSANHLDFLFISSFASNFSKVSPNVFNSAKKEDLSTFIEIDSNLNIEKIGTYEQEFKNRRLVTMYTYQMLVDAIQK